MLRISADTITLKVNDTGVTNVGDIKVYERSHRIAFEVRELAAVDEPAGQLAL
jgi:hypothetical protein